MTTGDIALTLIALAVVIGVLMLIISGIRRT